MPQLTRDEPVMVTSAAGSVVTFVMSLLVTHGVLTDTQASSVTQAVVPYVASAAVLGLGAVARRFVTPASKVAAVMERDGLLTDSDFARIEAVLHDTFGIDIDLDNDTDDDTPADVAVPDGMNAGHNGDTVHEAEHAEQTAHTPLT